MAPAKEERTARRTALGLVGGGALLALILWLLAQKSPGAGGGRGGGAGGRSPASAARCQVRVDAAGVSVNGQRTTAAGAALYCKTGGAMAEVAYTGDAMYGSVVAVLEALRAAQVPTLIRAP